MVLPLLVSACLQMRGEVGLCYLTLCAVTAMGLFNLIPVSVHMIISATVIIFIGAHGSVPQLQVDQHSLRDDVWLLCPLISCSSFSVFDGA